MKRFAFVFACLVFAPMLVRAAEAQVFISEVAWAGSTASTSDEWLEVCGSAGTDLSGWSIEGAGTNALVLPDGSSIPESGAFVIANYGNEDPKSTLRLAPSFVTTAVSLSNTQLFLVLRDAAGVVIDVAGASGTAPLAGTSGAIKTSMTRLMPLADGSAAASWIDATASLHFNDGATELGTPGACPEEANVAPPEPPTEAATSTEIIDDAPAAPPSPPPGPTTAVRISEVYPSPFSGEQEWVELTNISSIGEILDGWTIEDGKGTATKLAGVLMPWSRLVITAPKGTLNNAGDLVVLKDGWDRTIDGVAYGDWDTALHPRVGDVAKGEAVIRLELQDAFDVTTVPTPNAANVLVRASAPDDVAPTPSASKEIEMQRPTPQITLPVVLSAIKSPPSSPTEEKASSVPPRPIQNDKRVVATVKTPAKKPVASRYKGSAYSAVIAVPPGVYSKTKMYVLHGDAVREMRLSKSTTTAYASGQKISFVAQTKEDGGAAFLLANPNSIRTIGEAASSTLATLSAWPAAAGAYRFNADVIASRAGGLEVRLGNVDGDVLLPSAMPALKPGDRVAIEGFISPGTRPRVVLAGNSAVRLLSTPPIELSARDLPKLRLPWFFAAALTATAGGAGLVAYLRSERLKRLALVAQPLDEDYP
ncbi:MAG: lamin tail domain-containing protein [Patescibacteria group bacterium]|nr:MAG: lamin tail domain-containing protein [Patescibacteria group bacterium]